MESDHKLQRWKVIFRRKQPRHQQRLHHLQDNRMGQILLYLHWNL
ncbi:unnamed protein product [Strongylus vulgaris]|uniref:Uncharacterized protein n=1 Tax=Strongylus vulgaris TaxID=40348 RepID=A0A3P7KYW4_STRVU|nr:unnamed protein product [Strongylus vulgaris]